MLESFASPYSCIYSAAQIRKDPRYPEKTVMGTGPFKFVEYVPGSRWIATRFDDYFRPGLPYLDGYRALSLSSPRSSTRWQAGRSTPSSAASRRPTSSASRRAGATA